MSVTHKTLKISSVMSSESVLKFVEETNKLNRKQVLIVGDAILSFLIAPASINFQEQVSTIATEQQISGSSIKVIAQGLLLTFQEALNNSYSLQRLGERCTELGFETEAVSALMKVWKVQAVGIATNLLSKSLTNNQLIDMDWVFGVTASSDDCDHVGKTFLQLKLTLENVSGRKVVVMELTLDQFYQFLASMEKCKAYLDYVSPVAVSQEA